MRWKDLILTESQYDEMMQGLKPLCAQVRGMEEIWQYAIDQAKQKLRRKDRIVWFLRWYRLKLTIDVTLRARDETVLKQAEKLKTQYIKALNVPLQTAALEVLTIDRNFPAFMHFGELTECHQVQEIVWDRQLPSDLLHKLQTAEREWVSTRDQIISYREDDQPNVFLDLGDGWAWYDLETHACDKESKAMGHCGNAGGEYNQTILSLRRKVGVNKFRPSLTFILHPDGTLGEMKGRENNKPKEKYHYAIVALLKDPRIKGITGGGYLPQNNFAMSDLDQDHRDDVLGTNPMMRDWSEVYEAWIGLGAPTDGDGAIMINKIRKGLGSSLSGFGYQFMEIDVAKDVIVVERYSPSTYDDYYNVYTSFMNKLFDKKLGRLIARKYNLPFNKAENISQACKRAHFPELYKTLLPYDADYEASNSMHAELEDGEVVLKLPIQDYIENFIGPDKFSRLPETLDQVSDGDPDIENLIENATDPVDEQILIYLQSMGRARSNARAYATVDFPEPNDELVSTVYHYYHDKKDESFKEKNPNQIMMDLDGSLSKLRDRFSR